MSNRFKAKFNIKKGDSVVVITGDDKDLKKPRKVLEVYPDDAKVLVEGANIVTRHTKPSAQNTKGGLVKKEAPMHISNVMLWDAKKSEPTKVKRTRENGKLVRVSKISGEVIK
jgi:large subunit ribosomal protein L24